MRQNCDCKKWSPKTFVFLPLTTTSCKMPVELSSVPRHDPSLVHIIYFLNSNTLYRKEAYFVNILLKALHAWHLQAKKFSP